MNEREASKSWRGERPSSPLLLDDISVGQPRGELSSRCSWVYRAEARSKTADSPASASLRDATARHPSPAVISEGLVDQNSVSWNRMSSWLVAMDALRRSAQRTLLPMLRDHCQHGSGVIADETSRITLHLGKERADFGDESVGGRRPARLRMPKFKHVVGINDGPSPHLVV